MTHRLAFIGSCQVTGMRAAARQLRPDIEIEAHHIGAHLSAQEIADRIAGFDTVITQVGEGDPQFPELAPSLLAPKVGNLVSVPIFVFSGLHPDMLYIFGNGRAVPGPFSDMHSLIIVAGYLLGLSEERTYKLFNAYVFAELGYFAAYEASYQAMVAQFAAAGYNMQGMPERWLSESGGFMYTVNHPAIGVLSKMAVDSLKRAGLISEDVAPPVDVDDFLSTAFVAPILPPLARRIGLQEDDIFMKPVNHDQPREISLWDYIKHSFAMYQEMEEGVLDNDRVRYACDKLRTLLY